MGLIGSSDTVQPQTKKQEHPKASPGFGRTGLNFGRVRRVRARGRKAGLCRYFKMWNRSQPADKTHYVNLQGDPTVVGHS